MAVDARDAAPALMGMAIDSLDDSNRPPLGEVVASEKDAIDVFADLMDIHGIPEHVRADQ